MNRTFKNIILLALLLTTGSVVMAQRDPQFVIKRRTDTGSSETHYLAHVRSGNTWILQDATSFTPDCVWYSGNTVDNTGINHNYYFKDGDVYHFLYAPLSAGGALGLSESLPSAQLLRNTEQMYYFYDWDWDNKPIDGAGLARGKQYTGISQAECEDQDYAWDEGECWEVYWVEYTSGTGWKLSPAASYNMTTNSARFRKVTVTESVTPVEGTGLQGLQVNGTTTSDFDIEYNTGHTPWNLSASLLLPYQYTAYTSYVFEGTTHNYYNVSPGGPSEDHGSSTPSSPNGNTSEVSSYLWTLSGEGASYLSLDSNDEDYRHLTSDSPTPALYYVRMNFMGHQTALLTLTITYADGSTQMTTASILVKAECHNPQQLDNPVVTYDNVTVNWYHTADQYNIYWSDDEDFANPQTATVSTNTYTFTGLAYNTTYWYEVKAICGGHEDPGPASRYDFSTHPEPQLLIYGSVFGGGRMADVTGKTEVVVINCDTIGAIYGGNDIAGSVKGTDGSNIILGVDASDAYATAYNSGNASTKVRVNDVYGGGNGYYAYNGSSFEAATSDYRTATVAPGASVTALSESQQWDEAVWTNPSETESVTLTIPEIVVTNIQLTNDKVKVDSIFGGAKNAFVTHLTAPSTYAENGSIVTINGGTVMAVYGGNNYGGSQGYGKHKINVSHTTTRIEPEIENTATTGFGREFGIRYLFGGGNKVAGSTTDVTITGGQLDTIFGGGNQADVYAANVTVNCALGAYAGEDTYTYGNTYTMAINPEYYTTGTIGKTTIDTVDYSWDGYTGVYNVRTLFGGSNKAAMNGVPTVNLTSGSIGTVYGGGNAGDMLSHSNGLINGQDIKYGTHVVMNSPTILVDNLYGGCQVSNVDYSTWVEIQNGHVGNVYGGCNVSGDVGSTKIYPEWNVIKTLEYQAVQGGTYVQASGGVVYKDLFAGGNGFYHCNDGIFYTSSDIHYGTPGDPDDLYIGMPIPTHNETHAIISSGATIKGNVYAGGNLAPIGFTNISVGLKPFPQFVGLSSVVMNGGKVKGDVYGGGRMAAVYGSNEVQVSGGTIKGALYGGNDRLGMVAQITNRVLPESYNYASDESTSLSDVRTYVSVTGRPKINTVYGGGNGDYDYSGSGDMEYCDPGNLPIQSNVFVDINIDGYPDGELEGGHIDTVYGGGNGVTITGFTKVMLNVKGENGGEPLAYDHVGTIFGGNNKGQLDLLSDIILLKGQVNTVYGGCNQGAMMASLNVTNGGVTYENVGSMVRLRNEYPGKNNTIVVPTAKVSGYVYGGCCMNGVSNNSLVLVEGGNHGTAKIYGGSDISGDVAGISRVVVTPGTHNNGPVVADVFGGGNGNYDYEEGKYQGLTPPYCDSTRVEMMGGTTSNLFAGGNNGECGGTSLQVDGGTVTDRVFGGGNMAGLTQSHDLTVTTQTEQGIVVTHTTSNTGGTSNVTINNGVFNGGIFGGNNISGSIAGDVNVIVYGGTLGTSGAKMADGIFGGGYGQQSQTASNVTVTIDKANNEAVAPTLYADVYGGSALGQVNANTDQLTKIDFINGNLHGNIFGGGMGQVGDNTASPAIPAIGALVNGDVMVAISGGNLYNNVYGGCNFNGAVQGDIKVDLTGGTLGATTATADVFGGGFGNLTTTVGDVEVNVNGATTILYGDVYGGSGFGDVNTDSDNTTTVNILNGAVKKTTIGGVSYGGNIYGGGLGDKAVSGDDSHHDYPAHINGKVYVNIGAYEGTLDGDGCPTGFTGNATIEGAVYGCNNVNGTPLDSVFVHIYSTAHAGNNAYPSSSPTTVEGLQALGSTPDFFAINAVYGGGNMAAYLPPLTSENKPKCSTVHVWGCRENTIYDVYGGGNAADVGTTGDGGIPANTRIIIDGGRIHRMFGGGNGYSSTGNHDNPAGANYNPGANLYGTASSFVYAGLIDEVYGGANQFGSIDVINLNVLSTECCDDAVYGKVFGCANEAPINHDIVTTIGCGVGTIGELYGGSNLAAIGVPDQTKPKANVTLNLHGGTYEKVFGGSKGRLAGGGLDAVEANIYGDVTLNLYGGTVIDAFGGSDQYGSIKGVITVNVLDEEGCGLDLTNVFGGSNLADYEPWTVGDAVVESPIVNVMHIHNIEGGVNKGIRGNVYGGGYQAQVTSKPVVNLGYYANTMADQLPEGYTELPLTDFPQSIVTGSVFGGGELASVNHKTTVNVRQGDSPAYTYANKVFGGGDEADVDNTEVNIYDGTVHTGVYGGCNTTGNITNGVAVNILGGTLGTSSDNTIDIFGGGYGQNTSTTGDITVTFGGTGIQPVLYGDLYGGSALGVVSNKKTGEGSNTYANHLSKVLVLSGTVNGSVFGGGFGQGSGTTGVQAHAYGNTMVDVQGGTITTAIYGGCNVNGEVYGSSTVQLTGGTVGALDNRAQIFGGGFGLPTKVQRNVTVNFGDIDAELNDYPVLYGELYGGSALGEVNSSTSSTNPYTTSVNLHNGTITGTNTGTSNAFVYGAAYGGALGRKATEPGGLAEAKVYGKIYVKVGDGLEDEAKGNANLVYCDIYGCNNAAGCPQDEVHVDVYKTDHNDDTNLVDYSVPEDDAADPIYYAVHQVFGGGNEANYDITGKKTYVFVHNCDNTIYRVFGGGNAANVPGVDLQLDGGRFNWVFGGGNGERGAAYAAHVTESGVTIAIGGGYIMYLVNGSNMNGIVTGGIVESQYEKCETLVANHFCGSNSDDIFGDVHGVFDCPSEKRYVNLYGGSNFAQIYGDIYLDISAGEFQNVFGGSKGRLGENAVAAGVHVITQEIIDEHPELSGRLGEGGNIFITITGGSIGNLYGACDINGNIEGQISIVVNENTDECELFIGNIYGGGNHTDYTPQLPSNSATFFSPEIKILNGTVGGGFNFDHSTEANPIINTATTTEIYEGNIFGGGNLGDVTSNPKIIIGDKDHPDNKITIEGDVFGGGDHGSVFGSPQVIIAPTE